MQVKWQIFSTNKAFEENIFRDKNGNVKGEKWILF